MTRTDTDPGDETAAAVKVLRWLAIALGGLVLMLALTVSGAAVTDRPNDEVIVLDPDDPDAAAGRVRAS